MAALIGRHKYMVVSLTLHAALIALCYYFGSYRIALARQQELVRVGGELSQQSGMEKRVLDMRQINDLLEQSGGAKAAPEDQTNFSATSLPRTPDELLEEARQLSASIAEVEQRLKAGGQADAPAQSPAPTSAPAPEWAPAGPATPGQLASEIKQLETRARASLAQRLQDLQQRAFGGGQRQNADRGGASGVAAKDAPASPIPGGDESVAAERIAKFFNRDLALPKDVSERYYRNGERIFTAGIGQIPAVDASTMKKGVGRMLGRGGEFATRVYVNSWYLIGPFEGKHGSELFSNHRYPPEDGVALDAAYPGKDHRVLKWRYFNADSYPLVPPDFAEDAVYYGYTELMLDREQDLTMWIGADDDAQVWLNDEQVWVGGNVNKRSFWRDLYETQNTYARDFNMNEGKRKVRFKKGRNKLFFKLANGPSRTFFSLVLTK